MIYLVVGSTGQYSDREDWSVCYYDTEEQAHDLVEKLNDLCRILKKVGYTDWNYCDDFPDFSVQEAVEKVRGLDPGFRMDYTGTFYNYEKVEKGE